MESGALLAEVDGAVEVVRARSTLEPRVGVVLGTGLGGLAGEVADSVSITYAELPGFPDPTVETHEGRLILGTLGGTPAAVFQGRFHLYEGHGLRRVTFPVRLLRRLGAEALVVTGACGGMRLDWHEGDLILLDDHINFLGDNPLIGPNLDELGPRFPDMSEPYDAGLRRLARGVAEEAGIRLREGVYVAVPGPSLETRSEYRMLRLLGADVVGMSTVPEVIVARHMGMRVLGVSIVTDLCDPDDLKPVDVPRIIQTAKNAEPHLTRLVRGVVGRL